MTDPREDVAKAISTVEDSRRTHVLWVEYLSHPLADEVPDEVGDIDHHRKCIAGYDHVLTVLRRLAAPSGPQEGPADG